ncbi:hypothetical protein SRHO_G00079650 [Serrasalmus rhombeus]
MAWAAGKALLRGQWHKVELRLKLRFMSLGLLSVQPSCGTKPLFPFTLYCPLSLSAHLLHFLSASRAMAAEGLESQQVKMRKADASIWSPIRILSSQPLTSIERVQFGTRPNLIGCDYSEGNDNHLSLSAIVTLSVLPCDLYFPSSFTAFCPTGHLSCCSDIFAPPPLAKA